MVGSFVCSLVGWLLGWCDMQIARVFSAAVECMDISHYKGDGSQRSDMSFEEPGVLELFLRSFGDYAWVSS